MIKKIEDLNFYELLEISPLATVQEIHKAYERVRRVYEPNSIALYSLFTPEETAAIHQRIEEAYRTLIYEDNRKQYDAVLRSQGENPLPPPTPPAPKFQPQPLQPALSLPSKNSYLAAAPSQQPPLPSPRPLPEAAAIQFSGEFSGSAIKLLREQRGLTLRNIADMTKIGIRYLELIEEENFSKLPARPYLRGFLAIYAKALGCEPDRMISDYVKRYDATIETKPK